MVSTGDTTSHHSIGEYMWIVARKHWKSVLAFFEIPKGEKKQSDRDDIGGMQHCAFTVTPGQMEEMRIRFDAAGVSYDGPVDILPGLVSMYFLWVE